MFTYIYLTLIEVNIFTAKIKAVLNLNMDSGSSFQEHLYCLILHGVMVQ